MTPDAAGLDQAREVADAVLYEGYLLYPYRQSAQKNRTRFQFGVLMPPSYAAIDPSEPHLSQTECLLECSDEAEILVGVRFLQMQRRQVLQAPAGSPDLAEVDVLTVDGTEYTTWDEAVEREQHVSTPVSELLCGDLGLTLHVPAGRTATDITDSAGRTAGRLVRSWTCLDGVIRLQAQRVCGPYGALRLGVRIENLSTPAAVITDRDGGLACAFIAAHVLIWVPGGSFISMTDPPEWAAAEVAACENIGTWPVLAGPPDRTDLVLSSPVILYDHPQVAPESAGDLFDATEIDEILTLRTMALTDAEKRAARATDPRAADLIDRLDVMPPEVLDRLHGAIRYLRSAPAAPGQVTAPEDTAHAADAADAVDAVDAVDEAARPGPVRNGQRRAETAGDDAFTPDVPWWDPGSDTSVSPETDQVVIAGIAVARGSLVIMRPGARRADAQDLFLTGRAATVEAVLHDVDGKVHLAVRPAGDPAADLHARHGRFLYFGTDEVEPAGPAGRAAPEPAVVATDIPEEHERRRTPRRTRHDRQVDQGGDSSGDPGGGDSVAAGSAAVPGTS